MSGAGPAKHADSLEADHGQHQWVTGAQGQEGMDVIMNQGEVEGDTALKMQALKSEQAWDAVKLEAGQAGISPPEDGKADPAKGGIVNVVVWFGPEDPEVNGLFSR